MDDLYDVPYEEEIDAARSKLRNETSKQHPVPNKNERQDIFTKLSFFYLHTIRIFLMAKAQFNTLDQC